MNLGFDGGKTELPQPFWEIGQDLERYDVSAIDADFLYLWMTYVMIYKYPSWSKVLFNCKGVNRYRRGLETCPQAKTSKNGHAIFSSFRRVRATKKTQRWLENTRVHFWTFLPVSVMVRMKC